VTKHPLSDNRQVEPSFNIDLHVHTARYSSCAEFLDPLQIEQYCLDAGIQGVVLTEHDTCWNTDELADLQAHCPSVRLFSGIEVSTAEDSHLIVIGLEDHRVLAKGMPFDAVVAAAHEQAGLVILAHPFRKTIPPLSSVSKVDAIEIGSTSLHEPEARLSACLTEVLQKPSVACSDAHALPMIGWAYTRLPRQPANLAELIQMIRQGHGRPVLPHPFF